MFHDTMLINPLKYFRVLRCVSYTIIDHYVCIDYPACQSKKLIQIPMDSKYVEKYFNRRSGIGITDLLMKLLSCHSFSKNMKYILILKCLKRMLEYYFSKGFGILECNFNNLEKLPNELKKRIHVEENNNSEYVMTCINTITSTSNTLRS